MAKTGHGIVDSVPPDDVTPHWITRLRNPNSNPAWKSELGQDVIRGAEFSSILLLYCIRNMTLTYYDDDDSISLLLCVIRV